MKRRRKIRRECMDRGMKELVRGPFVKFRNTKNAVKCGYILSDAEDCVIIWTDGKTKKIKKDQIVYRGE